VFDIILFPYAVFAFAAALSGRVPGMAARPDKPAVAHGYQERHTLSGNGTKSPGAFSQSWCQTRENRAGGA